MPEQPRVWLRQVRNSRGRTVPSDARMESFYARCMAEISRIAREEYGDEPKVMHMIAVMGRAAGMFVCACFPDERPRARDHAIENMEYAIETFAREATPEELARQRPEVPER